MLFKNRCIGQNLFIMVGSQVRLPPAPGGSHLPLLRLLIPLFILKQIWGVL
jgi:hypothetical protein